MTREAELLWNTVFSLDPRDVRGEDINFYLTGKGLKMILIKISYLQHPKVCFSTGFVMM